MESYKLLIGKDWIEAASGEWITVHNPATSEPVGRVPKAGRGEADQALRTAAQAFKEWSVRPAAERCELLRRATATVREHSEEIARILTLEQGKPLGQARAEVKGALETLDYFAEVGKRILGEILPTESRERLSFVVWQPVGVVAAIVPWNYPVNLLCWKLGPALVSGCTVVAKPASQTPISALVLARYLLEGGLTPGVFNVVTGSGSTVGQELIDSPLSHKVSFTGSTEMGKLVMSSAAAHLKKVGLELGGSSPLVVLKDADIAEAVKGGVLKAFKNSGQICNSINRIYVERPLYDEYVDRFTKATARLTVGDGLKDPDVDLGPLIDEAARTRVREHVEDAVARGARLCHGGKAPEGAQFKNGFYFEPTVLADVNHEMRVMREETFGPIAPIMAVNDFEDAIARANDSPFGLVGYLYTTSLANAIEASRRMDCGSIGVNDTSFSGGPYPYPAWKESGTGVELSHHGLREFMHIKHIRVRVPARA